MAEETVLQFMEAENRPYNAMDVTNHMQKYGIKKPSVQKALESLTEKGALVAIVNNKSVIYHAAQTNKQVPSPEELKAEEEAIKRLQQEITSEQQAVQQHEKMLSALLRKQTPQEVEARVQQLAAECAEMERQLAPLRGKAVKTVSTEELQKREKKFCDMFTEFKKRKRMFRNVWDTILECSEKKAKVLEEEVGIEKDEDNGLDSTAAQNTFDRIKQPPGRKPLTPYNKAARLA